ncbi:MAG: NAD(P)/FAD-dependent oxidoreductase, partial [Parvibaculum sp.]|nr:NAD(P)/FAD-dependent oxidoreductase [Parvibaculum sp.]
METNGGAYKLFDEMADLIARTIMARAQGNAALDQLIASDRPDLTGGIKFVGSDRHATYVEIDAYRKQMTRIRKRFGWPDLADGCFDGLRVRGAKQAA